MNKHPEPSAIRTVMDRLEDLAKTCRGTVYMEEAAIEKNACGRPPAMPAGKKKVINVELCI